MARGKLKPKLVGPGHWRCWDGGRRLLGEIRCHNGRDFCARRVDDAWSGTFDTLTEAHAALMFGPRYPHSPDAWE